MHVCTCIPESRIEVSVFFPSWWHDLCYAGWKADDDDGNNIDCKYDDGGDDGGDDVDDDYDDDDDGRDDVNADDDVDADDDGDDCAQFHTLVDAYTCCHKLYTPCGENSWCIFITRPPLLFQ